MGDGDEVHGCRCRWFLGGSTDSSVAEPNLCFFGDDHGREAVVGRRDACWASGGSAVTNSLLSPLVCPGQRGGGQSGLSRVADRHELMAYGNLPSRGYDTAYNRLI